MTQYRHAGRAAQERSVELEQPQLWRVAADDFEQLRADCRAVLEVSPATRPRSRSRK